MKKATNKKNCLTCARFSKCKDKKKSGTYRCEKFEKYGKNQKDLMEMFGFSGASKKGMHHEADDFYGDEVPVKDDQDFRSMEINLVKMIDKIYEDSESLYPKDLKIDDSDLPEFDNVYEYFYDDSYGLAKNMRPFARQMWIAMQVFCDFCPRCSDPKFYPSIDMVPVDMKAINFPDRVQFLKQGVCPKCKWTRLELVKKGYLNWYRGLAACLTGDTRIFTDRGVLRLDSVVANPEFSQDINLGINNGVNKGRAFKFLNQGKKPVYKLTTEKGYEIFATKDHLIKSSNGLDLKWKELKDITIDDYVCISTSKVPVKKKYKLNLEPVPITHDSRIKRYRTPKYMDENLASVLGLLLSEGFVSERHGVNFINSDKRLNKKYREAFKSVFGIIPDNKLLCDKGSESLIAGTKFKRSRKCFNQTVYHKVVSNYLLQLGCGLKSLVTEIPECIFQADDASKYAFLAAYIEGDGSIRKSTIVFYSASEKMRKDLQVLLSSLGIVCHRSQKTLVVSNHFCTRLYRDIEPYLCIKKMKGCGTDLGVNYGFPMSIINSLLQSRKVNNFSNANVMYLNDLGAEVSGIGINKWSSPTKNDIKFLKYKNILGSQEYGILKSISASAAKKLKKYVDYGYNFDKVKSIEYVGKRDVYDLSVEDKHQFSANGIVVHNCIGQRAGKSVTFSFLESILLHKYLKMQKPSELLTGLPNVTLTATFTATDLKTAMETLWQPFTDILAESRWYRAYHEMLDYYGRKYGEETYRLKDTYLHYKHRKLFLSASSPNKRTLRGRTRFSYAIDELGWFDSSSSSSDKIRISADEIYGALDRSMQTITSASKDLFLRGYNNVTPPMSFNISSPSEYEDKIMSLVRTFKDSRIVLAVHLPTWEFNPKEPKRNFRKAYMEDPVKAERDFGANPPLADSPFIENPNMVERCFSDKRNIAEYEFVDKPRKNKNSLKRSARLKLHPHGDIYPAVLSLDAGFSNNSFALAVGHRVDKKVVYDTLIDIVPEKGKSVLDHNAIFESVVVPIIEKLNVRAVFADRWNSLFLLHKITEDFGIIAEQYSVKYQDFLLLKSFMDGGRVSYPRLEMKPREILNVFGDNYLTSFYYKPSSHLYSQCLTVQDNGKTVIKGTNKTDDIFRAIALGSKFLLDDEWCKENLVGTKQRNPNMGIAALAGGNASSGGVASTNSGKGIAASGSGSG